MASSRENSKPSNPTELEDILNSAQAELDDGKSITECKYTSFNLHKIYNDYENEHETEKIDEGIFDKICDYCNSFHEHLINEINEQLSNINHTEIDKMLRGDIIVFQSEEIYNEVKRDIATIPQIANIVEKIFDDVYVAFAYIDIDTKLIRNILIKNILNNENCVSALKRYHKDPRDYFVSQEGKMSLHKIIFNSMYGIVMFSELSSKIIKNPDFFTSYKIYVNFIFQFYYDLTSDKIRKIKEITIDDPQNYLQEVYKFYKFLNETKLSNSIDLRLIETVMSDTGKTNIEIINKYQNNFTIIELMISSVLGLKVYSESIEEYKKTFVTSGGNDYYNKYLKYKQKYLRLKHNIK
jgi:hypothetical protein